MEKEREEAERSLEGMEMERERKGVWKGWRWKGGSAGSNTKISNFMLTLDSLYMSVTESFVFTLEAGFTNVTPYFDNPTYTFSEKALKIQVVQIHSNSALY